MTRRTTSCDFTNGKLELVLTVSGLRESERPELVCDDAFGIAAKAMAERAIPILNRLYGLVQSLSENPTLTEEQRNEKISNAQGTSSTSTDLLVSFLGLSAKLELKVTFNSLISSDMLHSIVVCHIGPDFTQSLIQTLSSQIIEAEQITLTGFDPSQMMALPPGLAEQIIGHHGHSHGSQVIAVPFGMAGGPQHDAPSGSDPGGPGYL